MDDRQYEALRDTHPITCMVDTDHGMQLRLLADARAQQDWQRVEPTLEDAYLWLVKATETHEQAA